MVYDRRQGITLKILEFLNNGTIPSASDLEIENPEFWNILKTMQDSDLISGFHAGTTIKGEIKIGFTQKLCITPRGREYLESHR